MLEIQGVTAVKNSFQVSAYTYRSATCDCKCIYSSVMLFELKLFPLHTVKQTKFGAYINSIQTEPSSIRINGEKQQKNGSFWC